MITKGRPKSTNIVDRRAETKRMSKANNGNTNTKSMKSDGKVITMLSSTRTDAGHYRPRASERKVDANSDSPSKASKNRKYNRSGR